MSTPASGTSAGRHYSERGMIWLETLVGLKFVQLYVFELIPLIESKTAFLYRAIRGDCISVISAFPPLNYGTADLFRTMSAAHSSERRVATVCGPLRERVHFCFGEWGSAPKGGRHSTIFVDPQSPQGPSVKQLCLSSAHLCSGSLMV